MPEMFLGKIRKMFSRPGIVRDDMGLGINIRKDWKVLCLLGVIFFVVLFGADYYLFYNIDVLGGENVSPQANFIDNFDMRRLDTVVKKWEEKVKNFNTQAVTISDIVDPSL